MGLGGGGGGGVDFGIYPCLSEDGSLLSQSMPAQQVHVPGMLKDKNSSWK